MGDCRSRIESILYFMEKKNAESNCSKSFCSRLVSLGFLAWYEKWLACLVCTEQLGFQKRQKFCEAEEAQQPNLSLAQPWYTLWASWMKKKGLHFYHEILIALQLDYCGLWLNTFSHFFGSKRTFCTVRYSQPNAISKRIFKGFEVKIRFSIWAERICSVLCWFLGSKEKNTAENLIESCIFNSIVTAETE